MLPVRGASQGGTTQEQPALPSTGPGRSEEATATTHRSRSRSRAVDPHELEDPFALGTRVGELPEGMLPAGFEPALRGRRPRILDRTRLRERPRRVEGRRHDPRNDVWCGVSRALGPGRLPAGATRTGRPEPEATAVAVGPVEEPVATPRWVQERWRGLSRRASLTGPPLTKSACVGWSDSATTERNSADGLDNRASGRSRESCSGACVATARRPLPSPTDSRWPAGPTGG